MVAWRRLWKKPRQRPSSWRSRSSTPASTASRDAWLWPALKRIPLSPKGEYYLTDLVEIAVAEGLTVQALSLEDPEEAIGINTRVHLAEAEAVLRQRINRQWMLAGVSMIDPATTYIEPGVQIGPDTMIWPNTYLQGNTVIGERLRAGPEYDHA